MNTPMWVLAVGTISVAIGMLCDLCYDLARGRSQGVPGKRRRAAVVCEVAGVAARAPLGGTSRCAVERQRAPRMRQMPTGRLPGRRSARLSNWKCGATTTMTCNSWSRHSLPSSSVCTALLSANSTQYPPHARPY
jgi:hypothetical protein